MRNTYSIVVWFGVRRWVQDTSGNNAEAIRLAKGTFDRLTKRCMKYNRGPWPVVTVETTLKTFETTQEEKDGYRTTHRRKLR